MNFLKNLKEKKLFFLGLGFALLVAVLDLFSKRLVFSILEKIELEQVTANAEIKVTSFFSLVRVWNRGVSFGMFSSLENSQIIFCLIQFFIAFILLIWLFRNQKTHIACALALIIGGAFGNLVDRAKYGAVADFLDFHVAAYHWPAFNLADSAVFLGVIILVFEDFIFKKAKK